MACVKSAPWKRPSVNTIPAFTGSKSTNETPGASFVIFVLSAITKAAPNVLACNISTSVVFSLNDTEFK